MKKEISRSRDLDQHSKGKKGIDIYSSNYKITFFFFVHMSCNYLCNVLWSLYNSFFYLHTQKAYNSKPWRSALKEIEGNFGSAVMLTFCFLRFVLLLNAVLTVLWMVVIVIPFFVDPPASFSWSQFFGTGFSNFFQVMILTL